MDENLEVELSIVDEQGKAIDYATIWGYVLPRESPLAIGSEDLWRVTTRYQSSFEFVLQVTEQRPVSYIEVFPMGDASGHARAAIDYRFLEGSTSRRPPSMQVGFAVMKRGYLPTRIDFLVKDESHLNGKVVLKRDPDRPTETQPYLQEFERIRHELSDTRRNEIISSDTYERDEALRKALGAAGDQAITAGDNAAAARIYARMQYLPTIEIYKGRAVGFAQAQPYSEQSWGYLTKAYTLDPDNPYIASEYLFRRGAEEFGRYFPEKASDDQKQAFAAFLLKLHALMHASGPQIWPAYHQLYALWHRKSSDPKERAKMTQLLEDLYKFEPKFEAHERLLKAPIV